MSQFKKPPNILSQLSSVSLYWIASEVKKGSMCTSLCSVSHYDMIQPAKPSLLHSCFDFS